MIGTFESISSGNGPAVEGALHIRVREYRVQSVEVSKFDGVA